MPRMRAWRCTAPGKPLEPQEVDVPEPRASDVVVQLLAAGICRTDLHLLKDPAALPLPLTLGHEGAGTVAAAGPDAQVEPGSMVAIHPMNPCGRCEACSIGQENLCQAAAPIGVREDGTFAEFVRCRASALVAVPENVDSASAAIATDALLTSHHALLGIGRMEAHERVAVLGLGGLGLHAVQIAHAGGATVVSVDPLPSKRDKARELGAAETHESAEALREGPPDLVVDFVGSDETILAAQRAVRPGGRIVLAGLEVAKATLSAARLGTREISVLGATSGTREELSACLALLAAGEITPLLERQPLSAVPEQLDRLQAGGVTARVTVVP